MPETPTAPELQHTMIKWAFWGTVIAALIGASGAVLAALLTTRAAILPRLLAPTYTQSTSVSASAYPFADTGVQVEEGDVVQIIVQGDDANWDCGKGAASAEGRVSDRWQGHVSPSANQCELIGYIQEGVFIRIGAYQQFQATTSGSLHLGANDGPDSYDDNSGTLAVTIIVARQDR